MMIPEAWENHESMPADKRAFYEFHASLMEPWDGPASVAFTDGTVIGAVLDRNGLRPSRYWVTDDGLVVMASEVGVLDLPGADGRAEGPAPARAACSSSTPRQGRIVDDDEIKADARRRAPLRRVAPRRPRPPRRPAAPALPHAAARLGRHPAADVRLHDRGAEDPPRADGARTAYEPIGSMGTDTPVAVLSEKPRLLFDYFQQLFAQVTNPPLDAIREELVTSLSATLGPEGNLLDPTPASCRQVVAADARSSRTTSWPSSSTSTTTASSPASSRSPSTACSRSPRAARACAVRSTTSGRKVSATPIADGAKIIILSDRHSNAELAPIPALLLTVGGAPPPHPGEDPHPGRPHRRDRRGPRGAPHGAAARLRRRRHQPVPRLRDDRRHDQDAGCCPGVDRAQGRPQLHQGVRQGRAQGHVEDGHLDGRVVHRRPDLRGDRPRRRTSSTSTSPARPRSSAASASTSLAEEAAQRHRLRPPRPARGGRPPRPLGRAASTSGGARASSTCSTPRPSSSSSTRRGRSATTSSRSTRRSSTSRRERLVHAARPVRAPRRRRGRRCRSTRSSRSRRSSSGSPPARCATARSRPRPTRPSPSP